MLLKSKSMFFYSQNLLNVNFFKDEAEPMVPTVGPDGGFGDIDLL